MPDSSHWTWNPVTHDYTHQESGRVYSPDDMVDVRDRFIDRLSERVRELAARLARAEISPAEWEQDMRKLIKSAYIDQYLVARGGRAQMTFADWGRIGRLVRTQYKYLHDFCRDVEGGRYTDPEGNTNDLAIAARGVMYMRSSATAYERGQAAAYGISRLPAYPGQDCEGLANCRCHWRIVPAQGGGWACYWIVRGDENTCSTCAAHGREWNPLYVGR